MNVGQQTLGNDVIMLYSTNMFETMGGSKFFARFLTFILGIVLVVSGLFSNLFIRSFGRKSIIIFGSLLCAIILLCLGFFNGIIDGGVGVNAFFIFAYFAVFIPTMGATFWAYIGEICTDKAISIGLTFNIGTIIALTFTYPILDHYLGISTCFFIYAGMTLVLVVYQLLDLFETKGLTKQEIIKKVIRE
jgi:SP family sugar porter-like MFS transporter